jgi:pimeloyl-ACP methyl ester carboxylesterase
MRRGVLGRLPPWTTACGFVVTIHGTTPAQSRPSVCALSETRGAPALAIEHTWHDTSPHRPLTVTERSGVRLEVLDWGGRVDRPNVIWIPGANTSAHAFDDIAPRLTPTGRQLGLTPRGQFPSSIPERGYSIAGRLEDVLAVLDSLKIRQAVFIGHSMAGDILTGLIALHPERVLGLIYLDATYDRSEKVASLPASLAEKIRPSAVTLEARVALLCSTKRPVPDAELTELIEYRRLRELSGLSLAELAGRAAENRRRQAEIDSSAAPFWIGRGNIPSPRVPVLMIYAARVTHDDAVEELGLQSDAKLLESFDTWWDSARQPAYDTQRAAVARSWPNAQIVMLSHATHVLMWSQQVAVSRAIAVFLDRISGARLESGELGTPDSAHEPKLRRPRKK